MSTPGKVRVFDLRSGAVFERSEQLGVQLARAELRDGCCILCPTDTVFGILADAQNRDAIAALAALKGRSVTSPPPVLVESVAAVRAAVSPMMLTDLEKVADLWPGPLSLVMLTPGKLGLSVNPVNQTVAFRVPADRWLRELCRGLPLAASSANLHGQPTPRVIDDVLAQFGGSKGRVSPPLTLALDRGQPGDIASTILDLTAAPPRIVRHGALSCELIRARLPTVVCDHSIAR